MKKWMKLEKKIEKFEVGIERIENYQLLVFLFEVKLFA